MSDIVPTGTKSFSITMAETGIVTVPGPYTPGGLVISLLPRFASVKAFWYDEEALGASFNIVEDIVKLDTPAPGKVTIQMFRIQSLAQGFIELGAVTLAGTVLRYTALGVAAP